MGPCLCVDAISHDRVQLPSVARVNVGQQQAAVTLLEYLAVVCMQAAAPCLPKSHSQHSRYKGWHRRWVCAPAPAWASSEFSSCCSSTG